jgi:hypothetical protein
MPKDSTPAPKQRRLSALRDAYTMTRQIDRRIGLWISGAFLLPVVVFLLIGFLVGHPISLVVFGVLAGLLLAMIIFTRRAEAAAFSQVEGQPGAAAAALNLLRRGWTVTPGVAATRNQDVLHRAVGRPGIVLVSEGPPNRAANLISNEKRKLARYVPDVPIYDVQSGNETGQTPIRKLPRTLMKLPRNLANRDVDEVRKRLSAMDARGAQLPIPKGPLPKGMKLPRVPKQ